MERWNGGMDFFSSSILFALLLFYDLVFSLPAFISGNLVFQPDCVFLCCCCFFILV